MKISVVLATCNGAKYLAAQLDSLAAQRRMPDEIIVSDDASEDGTFEILQGVQGRGLLPLTLTRNEQRLGYAKNFVAAAKRAAGDVLMFCDQDDIWAPDKVGVVAEHMKTADTDVVLHDISIFFESGQPEIPSYYAHLRQAGFPVAACFKGCAMAIRRTFMDGCGWPPSASGITHDFWPAILAHGLDRLSYVSRPLLRHRIHAHNTSGWILGPGSPRPDAWEEAKFPGNVEAMLDLCVGDWNSGWLNELMRAADSPRFMASAKREAFRAVLHRRIAERAEAGVRG